MMTPTPLDCPVCGRAIPYGDHVYALGFTHCSAECAAVTGAQPDTETGTTWSSYERWTEQEVERILLDRLVERLLVDDPDLLDREPHVAPEGFWDAPMPAHLEVA